MITIYGLTDEYGQIHYVGQTCNLKRRWYQHSSRSRHIPRSGMAILGMSSDLSGALSIERKWIIFFGIDNLCNKIVNDEVEKQVRITFRITDEHRELLVEEEGDYGNISNVVRVILERYFLQRKKK